MPLATSLPSVHSHRRKHSDLLILNQNLLLPVVPPQPMAPASFPHQGLATSRHSITTSRLWVTATGSAFSRELEPTASASPRRLRASTAVPPVSPLLPSSATLTHSTRGTLRDTRQKTVTPLLDTSH